MRILTIIFLLISFTATAQNFDVLPTIDTVLATDKMLIRPLSTTSPALRRITLEQLRRFINRGVTAQDTTKWSLTGNAGTTAGTNFIGTTDNQDLVFKVAGVFAGWIDTGTVNTALGMRALYSTTSAIGNVAFGASALQNLTSGRENVAIGVAALQSITTTRRNTAIGLLALGALSSGDRNTALGYNAMHEITTGGSNVAIGNKSGNSISTANNCIFLGDSSGGKTTGLFNSVAIGYASYVDTNNAMILGNSSVNVGIGITKPTAKLHIAGNFRLVDGTQSAGYFLTSDANGNASWQVLALSDTATLDFGTIAPNGHETLTITVAGAALGDVVSLGIPNSSVNDHGAFMAWVSATDTVSVKCYNFDGVGFDPAAGVFKVKVFK